MYKRIGVWLLTAALLVVTVIAGQVSEPAKAAEAPAQVLKAAPALQNQVTLGFVYGAFAPKEKWEKYFEGFLKQHPEVTINYIPVPLDQGWGDYTQKILTLIVGGEKVDVIWNAIEAVPLMAEKGVLLELDSFMQKDPDIKEFIDDVHPKLLQGLTWKGKQYLLPFAWNNVLMFYSKSALKSAGLAEPAQNWTWDDFLQDAQKITKDTNGDGNPDVWGFHTTSGTWSLGPWTISNGTFWMNEDFSQPWYNNPKTVEAMQFAYDLVWKYKVAPSGDFQETEAFAGGTLGMFPGAPATREGLIPAGVKPEDYNINFWPTHTGEVIKGSIWGTDGYGIAKKSANPDLAWQLLKYLESKDVMSNLMAVSAASGSAPARRSLATSPEYAKYSPANYLYWYESLDAGRTVINSPIFATLGEIHDRYMTKAWAQEMSVADAAAQIQADMEAEIKKAATP